jgi:uncharacterized protein YlxW (UPF0749 family)
MPPEDQPFLTPSKLLGIMGIIVFSLIGVLWTINNNRINNLEEWRKQTDASRATRVVEVRTEIALAKERLQTLADKVTELKTEIQHLRDDLDEHRKSKK